jgi:hypothetical protein
MMLAAAGLSLNLLPLLGALAVITGAGSLLARLLRPGDLPASDTNRAESTVQRPAWGWSYLLGFAGVGFILQLPLAIDGRITHRSFLAVLGLCTAMSLIEIVLRSREQKRPAEPGQGFMRNMLGWVGDLPLPVRMLTMLCLANFVWFAAVESPSTFDARSIYSLKARILYDKGDLTGEDFRNPDRLNFNANYALLVPLVEATLFTAQGSQQDLGPQLAFVGIALALASILVAEIRRFEPRGRAAMWGACFLLLPVTLMPAEGGGMSGSADFTMAAFATAAAIATGHWLAAPRIRGSVLAGLMLGAAFLTKQEAMIWATAIVAALVGTMVLRRSWMGWRSLGTAAWAVGLAMVCLLISVVSRRGIPNSPYVRPFVGALRWDWIVHTWTRIGFIVHFAIQKLGSVPVFGFVWPFVAVVLLALRRSRTAPAILFWRSTVVLVAAAYCTVFTISPLHLEYQLRTAFYRLAIHVLPLFLLVAAEQLAAAGWSRQLEWIWTGKRDLEDSEIRLSTMSRPNIEIHQAKSTPQKIEIGSVLERAA